MKRSTIIILMNLMLILGFVFINTAKREKLINTGDLVLFRLRPVDPRSLMQGDYMILRYDVTRHWNYKDSIPSSGYLVFTVNNNNIAKRVRFQSHLNPLYENEKLVKYIFNNNEITIGSESYFFQEGTGEKYERAIYGGMRVDSDGNSTLVGLYGSDKKLIK